MNKSRYIRRQASEYWLQASNPSLASAFSIPTHLTVHERFKLYQLALHCTRVLEIGSYLGASACCFGAAMMRKRGAKIWCVDTWGNETMPEGLRDTYADFLENTQPYRALIRAVRGLSSDVVSQVRSETDTVDLLFIDGDHSYAAVRADWESYKEFLKPGCTVVFHDFGWAPGVQRVIAEEAHSVVESCGSLPNMWWGTLRR